MSKVAAQTKEPAVEEIDAAPPQPPADLVEIVEAVRKIHSEDGVLPAERHLAERLGVKRHQLRRGLSFLRQSGEIEPPRARAPSGAQFGALANLVRNTNPVEVVEMRIMIEPTLARMAALRATLNQISAMQKAVAEIARRDPRSPTTLDLHRMIAEASGNVLAAEFYALLRRIEADARLTARTLDQDPPDSDTAEHEAIIGAIAARAPEEAEAAMRAHLTTVHRVALLGA